MAEHFIYHQDAPSLRSPVLIAAFKGWNDAAESASAAVTFLAQEWGAQRVASLDGEEFYDYSQTRPHVRVTDGEFRAIDWPELTIFAYADLALDRDVVLLVGHEPNLRWKTFNTALLDVIDRLGVSEAVLLGALLADVPHTRDPNVVGVSSDTTLRGRLDDMGIHFPRYEGPTGIVGVLQDAWGRRGLPTTSLWGNVPHYITASPNQQVQAVLLRHVDRMFDLRLNIRQIERQARRFRARVDEAIEQNPEASAYVRELERRAADETSSPSRSPLPTGPEVVQALEEFLQRQQRGDDAADGDEFDE